MFAASKTVSLAEWIIDDTCLVPLLLLPIQTEHRYIFFPLVKMDKKGAIKNYYMASLLHGSARQLSVQMCMEVGLKFSCLWKHCDKEILKINF